MYAACAKPIVSVMKKCLALGYLALNEHLPPRHEGPDGCTQIDALNRKRERGAVLAELVAEGPMHARNSWRNWERLSYAQTSASRRECGKTMPTISGTG